MSSKSKIEWCDETLSPWWGCTKVSPGCANCYAENLNNRFGSKEWGKSAKRKRQPNFEKNGMALNRKAKRLGRRLNVFPSMCDPFDDEVPIEWFCSLLDLIRRTPNLNWLLLTKRPENWESRLRGVAVHYQTVLKNHVKDPGWQWVSSWLSSDYNYNEGPDNVWIGTSVEDQKRADERIPKLLEIPAKVRFLSCEPLLGSLELTCGLPIYKEADRVTERCGLSGQIIDVRPGRGWQKHSGNMHPWIDWVICGGESGQKARPMHSDWARSLRDQCGAVKIPFFFKQWGGVNKKKSGRLLDGREWNEFPRTLESPL